MYTNKKKQQVSIRGIQKYAYSSYLRSVLDCVPVCNSFLSDRYKLKKTIFNDLNIVLDPEKGRSSFNYKKREVVLGILYPVLFLYKIPGIDLTTPPGGVWVSTDAFISCNYVHEATHFIQSKLGTSFCEKETTVNQIDFLKVYYKDVYGRLIQL